MTAPRGSACEECLTPRWQPRSRVRSENQSSRLIEAVVRRNRGGETLSGGASRKRLDQELMQQEDILAALQRQVDRGDASESDCLEVRGRIVDLWDRLDNYVHWNYRQRLFREGDRSGLMLAWLLRRERPIPSIQMLCGPSGEKILGQLRVNAHLREHLRNIYTTPGGVGVTRIQEYLEGLRMPRLTEAQSAKLEGEVSLDNLVGVLGDQERAVPILLGLMDSFGKVSESRGTKRYYSRWQGQAAVGWKVFFFHLDVLALLVGSGVLMGHQLKNGHGYQLHLQAISGGCPKSPCSGVSIAVMLRSDTGR
ncbi:hypothetical protein NDU88_005093 [Pleurodeles waltl]|uniref:Uncharacterized protein n=1 Tax=Pleurodeles waltl TaxID=8319 RepID=A0AAV7LNA6_PLEWA|nr:hypothetical protein NDU88_005093 [Pleurodeles waltl]